jgi:RNA polymerase sigma factor (sigma-70 family)
VLGAAGLAAHQTAELSITTHEDQRVTVDQTVSSQCAGPRSASGGAPDDRRLTFAERSVAHLGRLLGYARIELSAQEALGNLPRGDVQPEDVVDAALLDALANADEAPAEGFYPWLRGFVRRAIDREVAAARPRRRQRSVDGPLRPEHLEDEGPPRQLLEVLPDPKAPVPEEVVEGREFQRALVDLLGQLPGDSREAFLLHVRDGLSIDEVAAVEGIPSAEVRRRIRRTREFLRARLAEEYRDVPGEPPSDAIFERLHRPTATADHAARIERQLAEPSR